jgi:hypothetical protein
MDRGNGGALWQSAGRRELVNATELGDFRGDCWQAGKAWSVLGCSAEEQRGVSVLYIDKEATIVSRESRSNRYAAAGGGAGQAAGITWGSSPSLSTLAHHHSLNLSPSSMSSTANLSTGVGGVFKPLEHDHCGTLDALRVRRTNPHFFSASSRLPKSLACNHVDCQIV